MYNIYIMLYVYNTNGFDGHLVEKLGTTPKLNFTESSFFEISTSNLEHNFFWFFVWILWQF